jgi:hypothetical protein
VRRAVHSFALEYHFVLLRLYHHQSVEQQFLPQFIQPDNATNVPYQYQLMAEWIQLDVLHNFIIIIVIRPRYVQTTE